uniref:EGF-like domain-containing protein n=1 Tax=Micrurus lemniscatus lemniscatus TaxID=129467 RepID=A0A2D4IM42_MICLE
MKLFSNKIKEFKLKEIMRKEETEMDRDNGPNLIFTFWVHLTSEEKNISRLLKDLNGAFVAAGKVQTVLVRDVNECNSEIGLCGNDAICLNEYGTYSCRCKEEYEDRSLTKSGTLCVRNPRSGLEFFYSYTEFIVGITVFCITVLIVVLTVLCIIIKKRCIKREMQFQEATSPGMPAEPQLQPTTFDHNNIRQLLALDPAQLKVRVKPPELPLQLRSGPSETYRVSIEQSERL